MWKTKVGGIPPTLKNIFFYYSKLPLSIAPVLRTVSL